MIFSVLSEKIRAISGKVFCPGTQACVTYRPGFELTTLGSSVRLANHPATVLDLGLGLAVAVTMSVSDRVTCKCNPGAALGLTLVLVCACTVGVAVSDRV